MGKSYVYFFSPKRHHNYCFAWRTCILEATWRNSERSKLWLVMNIQWTFNAQVSILLRQWLWQTTLWYNLSLIPLSVLKCNWNSVYLKFRNNIFFFFYSFRSKKTKPTPREHTEHTSYQYKHIFFISKCSSVANGLKTFAYQLQPKVISFLN